MMETLLLLLLFCSVSSSVRHSLNYLITASTGLPTVPEFMAVLLVNDLQSCYCSSNKTLEVKHDAWKQLFDDTKLWDWVKEQCFDILPDLYKSRLHRFMQHFNQSTGVHVLQVMRGSEWDNKTGEVSGFMKCGYDGEDLMTLNLSTKTWIPLKGQADIIKKQWDADTGSNNERVNFITQIYPQWLKMYLSYGNKSLLKPVPLSHFPPFLSGAPHTLSYRSFQFVSLSTLVPPSVSLLQKSPSSPVRCHATGFYPERATMFWSKDGEELHEDVDHGEILPNHDGSFQMRVDLMNISSVKPEDWRRYDCVFQFSGVKVIITKLNEAVIRTNLVPPSQVPVGAVIGVVVGLMLLSVCITGLFIWRKKRKGFRHII
ncbi:major histocompatibility complex class I-related gene protein-like isoform X1 [Channa argus]|uniref:major histocompatibility complex class I-related gene protein-like isoform X2 n=1 Tax=Channa argus TaxID=215402 RepID=UPI00352002E9